MKEMKKKLLKLLCIVVVAIVTFVGTKDLKSNAYDRSNLLVQNVEALTGPEDEPYPEERKNALKKEDLGIWHPCVKIRGSNHVLARSLEKLLRLALL